MNAPQTQYHDDSLNRCQEVPISLLSWEKEPFNPRVYLSLLGSFIQDQNFMTPDDFKKLIHKVGDFIESHEVPHTKRKSFPGTRDVIERIETARHEKLDLWPNTYTVPGCFDSLLWLFNHDIMLAQDVELHTGSGVNLQEGIRFLKSVPNGHGNAHTRFDEWREHIESLKLGLGDTTSVAHGTAFIAEITEWGKYIYDITIGDRSFIGINASIASGAVIGSDTTVWWWSSIGKAKIWNHTIIWMGSDIGNDVVISHDWLVPNNAQIQETPVPLTEGQKKATDTPVIIPYTEYIRKTQLYNGENFRKNGRRNFVIQLYSEAERTKLIAEGKYESDYLAKLNTINTDYESMAQFNQGVTRENQEFAVIDHFLAILDEECKKEGKDYWFRKEYRFTPQVDDKVKRLWSSASRLESVLTKEAVVNCKAYPKNRKKFITEWIPEITKSFLRGEDITDILHTYMYYPKINGKQFPHITEADMQKIFIGKSIIIGNAEIDGDSLIYDSYIRLDEVGESPCTIAHTALYNCIIHGWWQKHISQSVIYDTVVHGRENIGQSEIGEIGYPTTINSCQLLNQDYPYTIQKRKLSNREETEDLERVIRTRSEGMDHEAWNNRPNESTGIFGMRIEGWVVMNNTSAVSSIGSTIKRWVICSAPANKPICFLNTSVWEESCILAWNEFIGEMIAPRSFHSAKVH